MSRTNNFQTALERLTSFKKRNFRHVKITHIGPTVNVFSKFLLVQITYFSEYEFLLYERKVIQNSYIWEE